MRAIESESSDWVARFQGSPLLTIPQGQTTGTCDLFVTGDRYLDGGQAIAWGASPGDRMSFQIIDPGFIPEESRDASWPVLDEWVKDMNAPTADGIPVPISVPYKGFVNAGLGLRIKGTTSGANEVKMAANYWLHEKT